MQLLRRITDCVPFLLFSFPVALAVAVWMTYPFTDRLVSQSVSLSALNRAQRSNVETAVWKLNGAVVKPGAEFSFNRIVGPRTEGRGYRRAASYLDGQSVATEGGGICLLSSAVYQLALKAGLQIVERVPHSRTVRTVPAGFDATVWYGQADLRFKNTLDRPVQLIAGIDGSTLTISLLGRRTDRFHICALQRIVRQRTSTELLVEVMRSDNGVPCLLSRDHYFTSAQAPGSFN